jgi:hypothetical protein
VRYRRPWLPPAASKVMVVTILIRLRLEGSAVRAPVVAGRRGAAGRALESECRREMW